MKFYGFQKLTLLDFPGKVAATVFTGGCNFRCPFCHNAGLVTRITDDDVYEEEEILRFLDKRRGLLDGIAVTGGEPLLHVTLPAFLRRVREMGFAVKLDTNGFFPDTLAAIVREGLVDYVAMDVKNTAEKYPLTVGVPGFDVAPVERSIDYLLAGHVPYEFRTTVVREFHTFDDITAVAKRIAGADRYFLQSFVDSGNLIGQNLTAVDAKELEIMRKNAAVFVGKCEIRGISQNS